MVLCLDKYLSQELMESEEIQEVVRRSRRYIQGIKVSRS